MNCSVCGKNIDAPSGTNLIGLMSIVNGSSFDKEYLKQQLGSYESDKTYVVCWECWLKSMGVKP